MKPDQLHTFLKLCSIAGPVLESLMAPTADAFIWKCQRKAAAMLVDLGTGIGVADGALSLAGCVCKLLAPYRVEAENICWTYRDAEGQWGSFELRDRAVVFGQVPRQSEYGAIDFAMDFLGHKGAAPIDLVGLAMKGQEQRLAEVNQHWLFAVVLHLR
ncbi:hypothetical protein [Azotobacter chroococcum]|uniref:Uncharacterized protein n=1 Tax=Azotobacter chroococcum TaxID=353 RepID=A0AAP9YH16_9GAMM|nr:hypothetical protein [Azotobacter chroococcum]ASL28846.1 hypothetical protein ACG10_21280 [Azotobacter chroococcum]QQE91051.1 hypothetical protein GKQ51_22815 [Azotobacter chroococcum]